MSEKLNNLPEHHGMALTSKDSTLLVSFNLRFNFKSKQFGPINLFLSFLPSLYAFSFRLRTWELSHYYGAKLAKVTKNRLMQQTFTS